MRVLRILILMALLPISMIGQQEDLINKARTKEKYAILRVQETERFYLLRVTKKYSKEILLVVEKKSRQLKNRKIEIGRKYRFSTYSIHDVIQGHICHDVDGKEVWCFDDDFDLRFTDSMGNDIQIE